MRTVAVAFIAALIIGGCTTPTGEGGSGRWWPQEVGWSWLYEAVLDGTPEELPVKIEDTELYGGVECCVDEFGDYDAHEGELVAIHPASDTAFEIWDQKAWLEVEGFWVVVELRYTDPLTVNIPDDLNEPIVDVGTGDIYAGGFPTGEEFEVTLTSQTVETGVELEVQGNTYTDLRKVEFTMETDDLGPVTSEGFFQRGVGLVKGEGLWDFDGVELISYETP